MPRKSVIRPEPLSRDRRHWTKAEVNKLLDVLSTYHGFPNRLRIAADRLGRSEIACKLKAQQFGMYRSAKHCYNARQAAKLIGVAPYIISDEVNKGRLGDQRVKRPGGYPIQLTADDLWAWLENPISWRLWQPEHLTLPDWRAHFTEVRSGWLTSDEAARQMCVSRDWINELNRRGVLPARKVVRHNWYHREDVERVKKELYG